MTDQGTFDALTRAMVGGESPRRDALRILASGALAGLLARLGLDDAVAKKRRGKQHGDKKPSGQLHAAGKKHKKHKKKDKEKPEIPPLPSGCQNCGDCEMCQDGACVPDLALDGVHCGDPSGGGCHVCQGGQCKTKCQLAEAICCQGECYSPCENGCNINSYCGACNSAPEGKSFCPSQNRCVNNSCPRGWEFSTIRCQCAPVCPPRVSVSCPGVPADDWPVGGGETIPLPSHCCEIGHYRESSAYGEICYLPGDIIEAVKCAW